VYISVALLILEVFYNAVYIKLADSLSWVRLLLDETRYYLNLGRIITQPTCGPELDGNPPKPYM